MRIHSLPCAAVAAALLGGATMATAVAPPAAPAATSGHVYNIDRAHSLAGFKIRHLVTQVEGRFKDFAGTVAYDPKRPEASSVDVIVQASSIDTGTERRDEDLRSENFFDVTKFPTLTFKSTAVSKGAGNTLDVTGDLTMHGVTKRITIPVQVLGTMPFHGGEKAGFSTTFTVDRKDYGITWNRAVDQGGMLLGDEVQIEIQLETGWEPPKPGEGAAPMAMPKPSPAPTPHD